jgi:hypothetical protein
MNLEYGLFPKACDHEDTAEVGWLLYSTRQQNEERISGLISQLVKEIVGAKWKPIGTNECNRKAAKDTIARTYALHVEAAAHRAAAVRHKLSTWYGSMSQVFPDGTKMRIVPPLQTILSYSQKIKYAMLAAHQAAISSRICPGSTWELSANLVLDCPEPESGRALRQILLSIQSQIFPSTPLFHTVDRTWRSSNRITLTFHPENEADTRSHIASLIPFLKATESPWFMKLFTEEAKLRHTSSR